MCTQYLDLYSPSLSLANPISSNISISWNLDLFSTNGQSKKSPLNVAITVGLTSLICSKNRSNTCFSSGSLNIVKRPGYSGFGVYSKSAMSSEIISLLVMRKPSPSIIYEIIMTWSILASGNLRGAFVVSISNANTTGSANAMSSLSSTNSTLPCLANTLYHFPTLICLSIATRTWYGTSYSFISLKSFSGSEASMSILKLNISLDSLFI
ncbi:conserved hypothetical protein [Lodderomyces elongisporus NRRL YB-4239]|uniref:Uncharacterized protein n=1 Tax=Lodderomyces elongisporus (strain ATCC 11503 / CBS 2605 / JCM 1781 / NBRC 1676 / NRRL YB-4239) TaxID=379508 RepID=A5E0K9_LODEL|nr:conserved hypothetical protein [Lodderomyces elongisporus NRRL YB-4239]